MSNGSLLEIEKDFYEKNFYCWKLHALRYMFCEEVIGTPYDYHYNQWTSSVGNEIVALCLLKCVEQGNTEHPKGWRFEYSESFF